MIHAKGDKGVGISNQSGFFDVSLADHRLIWNARHSYIINGITSLIKMRGNFLTHLGIAYVGQMFISKKALRPKRRY